MIKVSTFLLYLLIGVHNFPSEVCSLGLESIRAIASFGDDIADVSRGEVPFGALLIGDEEYKLDQMLTKIDAISDQLKELTNSVNTKMEKVLTVLLKRLPAQGQVDKGMDKFHDLIVRIDGLYAQYKKYAKNLGKFNKRTINKFIKSVTSSDTGDLMNILNKMHRLFVPSTSGFFQAGLLQTLSNFQSMSDPVESCNLDYSFQQRLYEIYKTIVVCEIRGFVMTVFAYMILTARHNEPYTGELESAVSQLVLRSKDYLSTVQSEMKKASREIKFCGAERLKDDQWGEFTGLQSYIVVNEMQAFSEDTCYYTCGDIWTPKLYRKYKDYNYTPRINCVGRIHGCSWIGVTTICDQPNDSPKRYTWVDTENRRYGPDASCPSNRQKYLSWHHRGFNRCDNCICRCFQESATANVIRTFSLRPQEADVYNNMVVSGIKFTAKDDIIHLQIQQGQLLPQGKINKSSKEWIPLEDFMYMNYVAQGEFTLKNGERLTRGKDFTFITWDQQTINLDDIVLPYHLVITGARLNHEDEGDFNSPVEIQVRATFFDYESGTLDTDPDRSQWFTVRNTLTPLPEYSQQRTEYTNPGDLNDPTKSPINEPVSKPNQFSTFTVSNLALTAGNYTLPLFDLRPVSFSPSVALGGVGIYLKHGEDYGDILALKVFNIDISLHIDDVLSDEELQNYQRAYMPEEDEEEEEEEEEEEDEDEEEDDY